MATSTTIDASFYLTIPFVVAVMCVSGSLLMDTLRGVSLRRQPLGYYVTTVSTALCAGLAVMLVVEAALPMLLR